MEGLGAKSGTKRSFTGSCCSGAWVGKRGPLGASLRPYLQEEEKEAVLAACVPAYRALWGSSAQGQKQGDSLGRTRQKGPRRQRLQPGSTSIGGGGTGDGKGQPPEPRVHEDIALHPKRQPPT